MKRKKILFITYFFPPYKHVASVRIGSFAKYLKKLGYEITVLTSTDTIGENQDFRMVKAYRPKNIFTKIKAKIEKNNINNQLNSNKKEVRQRNNFLTSLLKKIYLKIYEKLRFYFMYPEGCTGWKKYAVKKALELHKEENFDIIISSSPPATTHLIAGELKKTINIPWFADYRDLWTQSHLKRVKNDFLRKYFEQKLEIKTLSGANAITTVSGELARKLSQLHKDKPVHLITNAFDPVELAPDNIKPDDKFSILYTGNIVEGRDPRVIFDAVSQLLEENRINRKKIVIDFYVKQQNLIADLIKRYSLQDIINVNGFIDRDSIIQKQRRTQLLLSFIWSDPSEKGIVSGKIFEYLAAKRPVLAVCPNENPGEEQAKIINEIQAGKTSFSVEETKKNIMEYYREYTENGFVHYKGNENLYKYSHVENAKKLDEIFRKYS